ncbi:sulfite exporter TauE/SafE family protein [Rheinheimera tilapiae]|jgi:uncharacterized membrane protein YfcA|uniref:Probable membrane transporter protein n=1 Tax=Rheinheimera tilapiae TaxID=875043 RepID=A0ABV6BHB6_9GAMM
MEIWWAFLILGAVVGFVAGLLGVGGGAIMVPVLTSLFVTLNFLPEHLLHMALATSMASIILTSIASARTHQKHQAVLWPVVRLMSTGIVLGTFGATFIASLLPTLPLAIFFSCFMAYVALQLLLNIKPKPSRGLPGALGMTATGVGIGGISALVAIGGGSLTVPFLTWCNVRVQQAIGTSAAIGLPIALSGSIGYAIAGWEQVGLPQFSLGYIYLPAVLLISAVSFFTAPLGASLAHKLPVPTLKKIFALLLLGLSAKMLHTILGS